MASNAELVIPLLLPYLRSMETCSLEWLTSSTRYMEEELPGWLEKVEKRAPSVKSGGLDLCYKLTCEDRACEMLKINWQLSDLRREGLLDSLAPVCRYFATRHECQLRAHYHLLSAFVLGFRMVNEAGSCMTSCVAENVHGKRMFLDTVRRAKTYLKREKSRCLKMTVKLTKRKDVKWCAMIQRYKQFLRSSR